MNMEVSYCTKSWGNVALRKCQTTFFSRRSGHTAGGDGDQSSHVAAEAQHARDLEKKLEEMKEALRKKCCEVEVGLGKICTYFICNITYLKKYVKYVI